MKKKIAIIVSIMVVLVLAIGSAYLIDKNRMDNNKPVIFSTWGYDYAVLEVIIAPPKLYMKLENNDDRITAITGTYSWTKIVNGVGQSINSDSVHPIHFDYKEENTILLSDTDKLFVTNENAIIKNVRLYKTDVEEVLSYDVLYKDKEITLDMQSNGEYILEIIVEYPEGKVFYAVKLVVDIVLSQHPLACLSEELETITICTIPEDEFNITIEKK